MWTLPFSCPANQPLGRDGSFIFIYFRSKFKLYGDLSPLFVPPLKLAVVRVEKVKGTKARRIDELMENLKTGDTLIVSEIILP